MLAARRQGGVRLLSYPRGPRPQGLASPTCTCRWETPRSAKTFLLFFPLCDRASTESLFRDARRCRPPLAPFSGELRSRSPQPLPATPAGPSAQPTPFVPVTHRTKMPSGRGSGTATAHCKQHLKPSSPIWQPLASVAGSPALPAGFNPCLSEPLFNAGKSSPSAFCFCGSLLAISAKTGV